MAFYFKDDVYLSPTVNPLVSHHFSILVLVPSVQTSLLQFYPVLTALIWTSCFLCQICTRHPGGLPLTAFLGFYVFFVFLSYFDAVYPFFVRKVAGEVNLNLCDINFSLVFPDWLARYMTLDWESFRSLKYYSLKFLCPLWLLRSLKSLYENLFILPGIIWDLFFDPTDLKKLIGTLKDESF